MKQLTKFSAVRSFLTLLCLVVFQAALIAQDAQPGGSSSTTTVTKHETTTYWYANPWVWVVGGAIFILLLVALLKGSSGRNSASTSDKVTVTKTVSRDV